MGFLKSKEERLLDSIIESINMNMANNYKDAAQKDLREFEDIFADMKASGALKSKVADVYECQLDIYREKLKGYTHKDQKPYWT